MAPETVQHPQPQLTSPEEQAPAHPEETDAGAPPPDAFPPEAVAYLQWLFAFHLLTIKQKLIAIAQKYHVFDEYGAPRFYVVRPPKLGMNAVAGFLRTVCFIAVYILAVIVFFQTRSVLLAIVVFFAGINLAKLIRVLLTPYRDIRVYTDETEQWQVLLISQDNKFGLYHWYTLYDTAGQPVARAKRNLLKAIWRRGWTAETLDGRPLCLVREDSLLLAILRRYLGPLWGLLRTNFDLLFPDGTPFGEYNRKFTIRDHYLLNLYGDPEFLVDRRVVLAISILLDTGEGR